MIVDEQGNVPSYPIKQCTKCGNSACKLAMDSKGSLLFWLSTQQWVDWSDIQSLPGWNNGWPPGMTQGSGATWKPINFGDPWLSTKRIPTSDPRAEKCDCGAAKADYTISALGGPGHSDWCRVYSK